VAKLGRRIEVMAFMLALIAAPAGSFEAATADDTAWFLAGLPLSSNSPLASYTKDPAWQQHTRYFDTIFAHEISAQLSKVREFSKKYLTDPSEIRRARPSTPQHSDGRTAVAVKRQLPSVPSIGNAERGNGSGGDGLVSGQLKPEAHFVRRRHIVCIREQTKRAAEAAPVSSTYPRSNTTAIVSLPGHPLDDPKGARSRLAALGCPLAATTIGVCPSRPQSGHLAEAERQAEVTRHQLWH
jgi:hypothetical protein